ncbi:hypothetical protein HYU14_03345 [Candidatus Woesearchaeota archaeon]|nr:hypothetical protein [Candidatus Woesearchaeota archaeon]
MELIARVSTGSRMDQIYIAKQRDGFPIGSYVLIKPLETVAKENIKLFPHNIAQVEPVKLYIIKSLAQSIKSRHEGEVIVFGSFLNPGFRFNDVDVILLSSTEGAYGTIGKKLEEETGLKIHLTMLSEPSLLKGIATDPLFALLMNNHIATKRMMFDAKRDLNFKLLDLHLQKSKMFIENFEMMAGSEKLKMVRNLAAIEYFMKGKKFPKQGTDALIDHTFSKGTALRLRDNTLLKEEIKKRYRQVFDSAQKEILKGISDGAQQK